MHLEELAKGLTNLEETLEAPIGTLAPLATRKEWIL